MLEFEADFLTDQQPRLTKYNDFKTIPVKKVFSTPHLGDPQVKKDVKALNPKIRLAVCCVYNFKNRRIFISATNDRQKFHITSAELIYRRERRKIEYSSNEKNEFKYIVDIDKLDWDRHVLDRKYFVAFDYSVECLEVELPMNRVEITAKFKIEIPHFQQLTEMIFAEIPSYDPSTEMRILFENGIKYVEGVSECCYKSVRRMQSYSQEEMDNTDYSNRLLIFRTALTLEDLETQKFYCKIVLQNVQIHHYAKFEYYFQLNRKILPERLLECKLILKSAGSEKEEDLHGTINKVVKRTVFFGYTSSLNCSTEYCIRIVPNRQFFMAIHNALDFVKKKNLIKYLGKFEEAPAQQVYKSETIFKLSDIAWCNKDILANAEQKMAVRNILNCTAFPFPYVVFGPPGTGKTTTLVEAVIQILKNKPSSKVLVTCQSNSACDEIANRLLKFISSTKLFRWYAKSVSRKFKDLDKNLGSTSNIQLGVYKEICYEEFNNFDVIITTLVTCKRMHRAMITQDYFKYIFIDECASTIEPESLIPITGCGSTKENITASIVLLGDHMQLGAVVNSRIAVDMGLKESLMERIMKQKNYSRHDPNFVTQLLHNYRSHPDILSFPNEKFYNSTLRAVGDPLIINSACDWEALPNKRIPIIFHGILSDCERDDDESWINFEEIDLVAKYVADILKDGINGKIIKESGIGVISPYRGQVDILHEKLKDHPDIDVGVIENFQGREKDIVIMSMVKSYKAIGFLQCEKRLNTAVTRARSLMIIIGNPITLSESPIWKEFLWFCFINNLVVGEKFRFKGGNSVQDAYVVVSDDHQ